MAINLLALQPHKVSRDLSGYITYIYGDGGVGKTTFGAAATKPLLLATERGYNALPGIIAQDIITWSDMKSVCRELKKPEVKDTFSTIIVDTVDLASQLCEKYICGQLGIENIGDGGWTTNGWAKAKKEWEQTFRSIVMEGYALIFISHAKDKTFKRKDGTEYNQVVPSCPSAYNEIIKNMSDIMGYVEIVNGERKLILRSADDSISCKCRFKEIESEIPFSYSSLVAALNRAIDAEANSTNNAFITTDKIAYMPYEPTYNFEELQAAFSDIVGQLMKNPSNSMKITQIVEKNLGKGKKFSDCTPAQCEQMDYIVDELKSMLNN